MRKVFPGVFLSAAVALFGGLVLPVQTFLANREMFGVGRVVSCEDKGLYQAN